MEFFKPGVEFDFMKLARICIPVSMFMVLASVVLSFYPGPNYGTDFRGGTEVEVAFKKSLEAGHVRELIEKAGFQTPDVVEIKDSTPNHFLIRVQDVMAIDDATKHALKAAVCYVEEGKVVDETRCPANARASEVKFSLGGDKITMRYDDEPDLAKVHEQIASVQGVRLRKGQGPGSPGNVEETNKRDHRVEVQLESKGDQLMNALRQALGPDVAPENALRTEWVGPKAGKQLRESARNAIAIAIVFIMIYLAFRFDLRFAPGVVVACLHDAMLVLGAFILLRKEVTLSTIAAILTVVGFSMNDTVVVYDRIRENLSKHKGLPFAKIINMSVSETLSRTILTSGATMLSVLAFFIWGTGVIKDFALAMVIGIVVGTYSSIYVAAPLTEWIDQRMARRGRKSTGPSRSAQPA